MQNLQDTSIYLAPLQGYTDFRFRSVYHLFFKGIDKYFTPWIKLTNDKKLIPKYINEVNPANNRDMVVVPQIMANKSEDIVELAVYLNNLGYKEVNWNLGCPHPTVAKRNLGSGLLSTKENIIRILQKALPNIPNSLSIKTRIGYENPNELLDIIEELNSLPIKEIIIHPRTGKQMYKGDIDYEVFAECLSACKHKVVYNGGITDKESFLRIKERFPQLKTYMIGRGVLSNPFLPELIKEGKLNEANPQYIFMEFHDKLLEIYKNQLSGEKHLLQKMIAFWEYFAVNCTDSRKALKKVKKSKCSKDYIEAANQNISTLLIS